MADKLLAWEIGTDGLPRLAQGVRPALEVQLEDWIEHDITLVDPGLMLLGRQITTSFGTTLDILGIDASGDLAIVELKRDRSPRDMVAQVLEYTAWVADLDYEAVVAHGLATYGSEVAFREAFEERFSCEFPDSMNEGQRLYLVAPEMSASVMAVTEYLSGRFNVPINAVTFALYAVGEKRLLVRSALVEEQLEPATTPKRGRRRNLDELLSMATSHGTREVVDELMKLKEILPSVETSMSSIALKRRVDGGGYLAAISIYPSADGESNTIINIPRETFANIFGLDAIVGNELAQQIIAQCDPPVKDYAWGGWSRRAVTTRDQAEAVVALYRQAAGA